MSEQVDPRSLRPGDRVRVRDVLETVVTDRLDSRSWNVGTVRGAIHCGEDLGGWSRTWELIDRPKPKLGSLWRDQLGDLRAVVAAGGDFVVIVRDSMNAVGDILDPHVGRAVVRRLVPWDGAE